MQYKAKHYVAVAGRTYVPGDCFEYTFSAEDEARLIRLEAIECMEARSIPAAEVLPEETMDEAVSETDAAEDAEAPDMEECIVARPARKRRTGK